MAEKLKGSFTDLIMQLRTIHQMIVLICVTFLLAVTFAERPDTLSAAIQDMEKLQNLTYWENWNTEFISDAFYLDPGIAMSRDIWYQDYFIEFPIPEFFRGGDLASEIHTILISGPLFTFTGWDYTSYLRKEAEVEIRSPKTLIEFEQLWEKSRQVKVIYTGELLNHAYIQRLQDSPVEKVDIQFLSQDEDGFSRFGTLAFGTFIPSIFDLRYIDETERELYGLSTTKEWGHGDDTIWKFWIPARSSPDANDYIFNANLYLCNKLELDENTCDGAFEQAFPELYITTREFRSLSFADGKAMLESQREEQLQSINLLGLRLPASQLSWIGTLIILILQLYFFLHLAALAKSRIYQDVPAWIGIFSDPLSRGIAAGSVTLLPMCTIVFLNLRMLLMGWQNLLPCIFLTAICIALSRLTYNTFLTVWGRQILLDNFTRYRRTGAISKLDWKITHAWRKNKR